MITILVERKVAAGSIAAAIASGLVALAVFLGKKFGVEIDPMVATPVATTVVVYTVTFIVGYVTKHTNRPDLADDVERMLGLEPTDADPEEVEAADAEHEGFDNTEVL